MAGEAGAFCEEFLANQKEYRRLGPPGDRGEYERGLFEFLCDFNGFGDYSDLQLRVPENLPVQAMASSPVTIAFLRFVFHLLRPRRVLEIGSYVGISALMLGAGMADGSVFISLEKGDEFARLAQANVRVNRKNGADITIKTVDALHQVTEWAGAGSEPFDLIFLDGDKERYDSYLEPLDFLLVPGGMLIVDDALFHGDVLNEAPNTTRGNGVKRLLEAIKQRDWPMVLLPLANGLLLAQKR